MNANTKTPDLHLSFDVGHSSIGWAVLRVVENSRPHLLGCGAVIFRADDCLASTRRSYRRQRRHIRSTRQRIKRLKVLLKYLGVLDDSQLDRPGCAWPWQLAARVLCGGKLLNWPELWDVLRWYAHNRGYDGNRRWSAAEAAAQQEDTEKEENARQLMRDHGTKSMAETFCKVLGVEPLKEDKRSSMKRFKGLNAAFPRAIVEGEVRQILQAHFGKLKNVDVNFERSLLGHDNKDKSAWQAIPCPELKLPRRYQGGLLFGQLVPRFDNRIISKCPITGQKVPSRNCPEFFRFRWAMTLANVRVARFGERDLSPLTPDERGTLDKQMREAGAMTEGEFKKAVREATSAIRDNLDTMLMHPDAKEALLLDPVQKLVRSDDLAPFWALLPERVQKRLRGQWRRGKTFPLAAIREQLAAAGSDTGAFDAALQQQLDGSVTRTRRRAKQLTREEWLGRSFPTKRLRLDGRAAYARPLLQRAFEEVMAGKHPKEEDGCLFLTEKIREEQLNREIAEQTNNHLVRHRLLILERVLRDIVKEYAAADKTRVARITIEVNRDLREMSGKTAKEKAQDLGLRIANHHHVAAELEESLGGKTRITAGLIRKARIADDLGWTCPYTGQKYEPVNLAERKVDKDHIVPRSDRTSDALESLVITYSEINKWKGKRTAWQFVEQEQGKPVPGLPNLSILSLNRYRDFVEALPPNRDPLKLKKLTGHTRPIDDDLRRWKRKELLKLPTYTEKTFLPRDLTQTSQLVRMGAQVLRRAFRECPRQPVVVSLPGSVTGEVRKAWKVLGCLSLANPQVLDEKGEVRKKDEIRGITHLHHALDACVLGFASHFIPNNGRVWELIVKRNLNDTERSQLGALGVFGFDSESRFSLRDLGADLKEQIRQRIAEKRVVQHIPARMDGLRVEQNTWRVVKIEDGEATIRQRIRQPDGKRPVKEAEEKVTKLLGLQAGKLLKNKGVLVVPDNFGVALDPEPIVISFHKVWPKLQELRQKNNGRPPRVLRNGQLIRVKDGTYKGTWRILSIKNKGDGWVNLDLGQPDTVRSMFDWLNPITGKKMKKTTPGCKLEANLKTVIKGGLMSAKYPLTGIAPCPTTSSA